MAKNWDTYSRQGIDLAHSASSFGFSAAKAGTRLGFSIARGLAAATVGLTSTVLDIALFGGSTVTRPVFGYAVSTALTIAEQITLAPIHLSEYITSTSLLAAHSSINVLAVIFPGSSDASFSLASFIDLVRREWTVQNADGTVPGNQYGLTQVARAIVGWVSLQGVTQEWQEKRWFKYLREMDVKIAPKTHRTLTHRSSRIRVTSDVIFPGQQGPQIIAADIGEPEPRSRAQSAFLSRTKSNISLNRHRPSRAGMPVDISPLAPSNEDLKATMRRLSKMVLAGYGGASLLFFGVSTSYFGGSNETKRSTSPPSTSLSASMAREKKLEETQLANAVDAAEAEAAGDGDVPEALGSAQIFLQYSWWDVLLGKHDQEIFEQSTSHSHTAKDKEAAHMRSKKNTMKATAVFGKEHLMPRFWVLTDHGRGQVVLVIRGTMSLNEIAVDLTCEPDVFQPATTPSSSDIDENPVPGQFVFPEISEKEESSSDHKYHVHGGMLRLAKAMGDVGKPVHQAVLQALYNNPEYDLVLCGHSLGAGVAAILGMIWADPKTCLTVRSSGLPIGRRVSVYAFAPPALTDAALSRLSDKLIVSLVYSHDIVSRLSLGSVRDLKNAAMWLCEAESGNAVEGWSAVTARAKKIKNGEGSQDDMDWLVSVRKTLEANMQNADMYPPGRVLWAMREGDLHPSHQLQQISEDKGAARTDKGKLRLFEVLDVEKVFSQIVFARDMLTAHMPHQYDRVLHDLL
ncbi:Diacylglycerol lipase-beta [Psilocybe cubensis]|uniref:sn-1-specific diacylglycerol lipase n=2 Tax=Psilocybe cubensis TaxID=181762 RepID=A0A8H7XZB6_PSICU|nr:Diacylglycerol lipase-beta [Psilocybe cubensis]KAH9483004.1 Diacylglycerol lipase-beta [Psilocybe cubensis]